MNLKRSILGLVLLLWCTGAARGYLVGPAEDLEKLTAEADIIFKAKAVSGETVNDPTFQPYQDFHTQETQFDVISVIKGQWKGGKLKFRHYAENDTSVGRMFEPQHYRFETGRTYIVFAKANEASNTFHQLWVFYKAKPDQGVLLCANDKAVAATTIKEALWSELMAMLGSSTPCDVVYAIHQLDEMSRGKRDFAGLADFDRKEVLTAMQSALENHDLKIAEAAISVVGSHNPYMGDGNALYWLATVGSGEVPGIAKQDAKMKNPGGELYSGKLLALANSNAASETRALAIRALGLVREPKLLKPIRELLSDPFPNVRAAATLLLADFSGAEPEKLLTAMTGDRAPEVRISVANAIGFAQRAEMVSVLAKFLNDIDARVRQAAAMDLLSFSPKDETIRRVFKANLQNLEFHPLFLIALARENPKDYLEPLAKAVIDKAEPTNFWGGKIPAFAAWEILFRQLQGVPTGEIRSGRYDRYLDAIEKVGNYSSSEPRDIYAFYVQRGMMERAQKYRESANKKAGYDLDYFFKQVDANPSLYNRD